VAIPQLDTLAASHQMPMKVYDAMAMGRPIVASTVSDLPVVLKDCARLVPPADVGSLAKAMEDLLRNPFEAQELGQRARAKCVQEFSMERVGEALRAAVNQASQKYQQ